MKRFRIYLREKYGIEQVLLFVGAYMAKAQSRYDLYRSFGYEVVYRPHSDALHTVKKGNVDTDIVFQMMLDLYEAENLDKVFLVSGDGDYWRTVQHIREKEKLGRVLLPSHRRASSLYKRLPESNKAYLDNPDVRRKISSENGASA